MAEASGGWLDDDKRSRDENTRELGRLRNRVAELEAELSEKAGAAASFPEMSSHRILHHDSFHELDQAPKPLRVGSETTESIELKSLFTRDVTTSGSFDVRGGIWATTFGKVIQALPIPVFLVDESLTVTVANQACGRFTPYFEKIQRKPFASLLGGPSAAEAAQSVLEQVFLDRKARIGEGMLRIDNAMLWARMTFRSIRIMNERFVIVLVEDLTREKVQLHENEVLRQELEQRVLRRTGELRKTNEDLTREVAERKRAEEEKEKVITQLQQALAHVKKLSGLLPICASCKKIRDDRGYWLQVEEYIRDHSEAQFSHGICPECARKLYPEFFADK
jgi:PAS domain-containing protein